MKVLITGNLGYVGSALVRHLRSARPDWVLHGFDNAYFAHCLTAAVTAPERCLDRQDFGDVRDVAAADLEGYDAVIQLAAVSNDPMGDRFADATRSINQDATLSLAQKAANAGVRSFVFASSCSVYGVADGPPRREGDALNPVTAYARSKIGSEEGLAQQASDMTVTCLRFATACGMSDRLRLDLVLNDFVAGAITSGRITILSDGTPWRPLIDVRDMARAFEWAAQRPVSAGGRFLAVNVGSDERNHQVRDLANAVAAALPGTSVSLNDGAPVDSRSYKVDFGLYRRLAPDYQPTSTLEDSIAGLTAGLTAMGFGDPDFRNSSLIRLKVLQAHIDSGRLSPSLRWLDTSRQSAAA